MLFAGLAGFFKADAENMKAQAQARRAAEAELLKDKRGFQKQLILNSIKNNMSDVSELQKQAAKGEATLSDAFRQSVQARNDYDANYEFGTPYNPPQLDYATIDFLNSDYNFTFKDDDGNKLRFFSKLDGSKNSNERFLQENMSNYSSDKNYWKNMSPSMLTQVFSRLEGSVLSLRKDEMSNKPEGYIGNNYYPDNPDDPYYVVTAGLDRMKQLDLFNRSPNEVNKIQENHNTQISENIKKNSGRNVSIAQIEKDDKTVSTLVVDVPDNLDAGHTLLSEVLNTTKGNSYQTFQKNFYKVAGADDEDTKRVFLLSARLGQEIPNIASLSPEEGFLGDDEKIVKIHQIMNKSGASFTDLTFALAPYMPLPAEATPFTDFRRGQTRGALFQKQQQFAVTYAGGYFAGKSAKAEVKTKAYKDAEKQYIVEEQVGKKLEDFFDERAKLKDQTGIASEFVASLKTKILAVGEIVTDVMGEGIFSDNEINIKQSSDLRIDDTEGADDTAENDKTLTAGYLENLKRRALSKATKKGKVDVIIGRLQAMRITLAFMMARAADPSGRLSNQDIEQQFVKLGGNFTTEAGALSGIKIAIDEFQDKAQVNKNIFNFVRDRRLNSGELYKLIDSAFVINNINNRVERMSGVSKNITQDGTIDLNAKYGKDQLDKYGKTNDPNVFIDYENEIFVNKKGEEVEVE